MARKLSRLGFFVVLLVIGCWLVLNMPAIDSVGSTPSSRLVTFSVDQSITRIHRNLREAHHVELRADYMRENGIKKYTKHYKRARNHFRTAAKLGEEYDIKGYLNRRIRSGLYRVNKKLNPQNGERDG